MLISMYQQNYSPEHKICREGTFIMRRTCVWKFTEISTQISTLWEGQRFTMTTPPPPHTHTHTPTPFKKAYYVYAIPFHVMVLSWPSQTQAPVLPSQKYFLHQALQPIFQGVDLLLRTFKEVAITIMILLDSVGGVRLTIHCHIYYT